MTGQLVRGPVRSVRVTKRAGRWGWWENGTRHDLGAGLTYREAVEAAELEVRLPGGPARVVKTPAEAVAILEALPVGAIVEVEGRFATGGGWGGTLRIRQADGDYHTTTAPTSPGLHGLTPRQMVPCVDEPERIAFVRVLHVASAS